MACHLNYKFTSNIRITTPPVENKERRSLLHNTANYNRDLHESIVTDDSSESSTLPPAASEIIDIDCGYIFLIASQTGEETDNDERSNKHSALLCHYAKNCKKSGWPSRIVLPLLLCHGVDDYNGTGMSTMLNATTAISYSSQTATKASSISTTLLAILLFASLLLYLLLLFRLLATTADNYFSPALETFSFELGLPPRFAGATLLALGNGSPDLGSTVNAILLWNEKEADDFAAATQGWTMSLGDLIGGGMFVGTIVCGLPSINAPEYNVVSHFYVMCLCMLYQWGMSGTCWNRNVSLKRMLGDYWEFMLFMWPLSFVLTSSTKKLP